MTNRPLAASAITTEPLAQQYFESCYMECSLDEALMTAFGADPEDTTTWPCSDFGYDPYDSSFELWSTKDDFSPTNEQLDAVWALGFGRGWICYRDGTEIFVYGHKRGERKPSHHAQSEGKRVDRQHRRHITKLEAEIASLLSSRAVKEPE